MDLTSSPLEADLAARPQRGLPDSPSEILGLLPTRWHEQFLSEYYGALDAAHEVSRFQELCDVLRLWGLRAVAHSKPSFEQALQAAREGRAHEFVPAEHAIPGWSDRQ
jgi:hypothetical protein